jgi:hypothetical protein
MYGRGASCGALHDVWSPGKCVSARWNPIVKPGALWLCLVLPSVSVVEKYSGRLGVAAYCVATACAVWSRLHIAWRLNERAAMWLSVLTFAGLAMLFAVTYPIANTHVPGTGSDDDDALNIAVAELIHGHHPYYQLTYLGNLIHHFAGAFLLATPFVLLGTSALQNLFWLALFFALLRQEMGSTFLDLSWFWFMLMFIPVVVYQLITGTGHVTNGFM